MNTTSRLWNLLWLVIFAPIVGCWGSHLPKTYPVEGLITFQGKPIEGATVSFVPSAPDGLPAGGTTTADGSFTLKTYIDSENLLDGAVAGDFVVTVSKMKDREIKEGLKPEEAIAEFRKLGPPKSLLPLEYQSPNTSKLKATVGPKMEPLRFEIQ